eukprot:366390-Chlamydomonas_euryale.AAC.34
MLRLCAPTPPAAGARAAAAGAAAAAVGAALFVVVSLYRRGIWAALRAPQDSRVRCAAVASAAPLLFHARMHARMHACSSPPRPLIGAHQASGCAHPRRPRRAHRRHLLVVVVACHGGVPGVGEARHGRPAECESTGQLGNHVVTEVAGPRALNVAGLETATVREPLSPQRSDTPGGGPRPKQRVQDVRRCLRGLDTQRTPPGCCVRWESGNERRASGAARAARPGAAQQRSAHRSPTGVFYRTVSQVHHHVCPNEEMGVH